MSLLLLLNGTSGALTPRRALYWAGSNLAEIPDALLGSGLKPIVVLDDGTRHERVASEGTPVIVVNGFLITLNTATESLLS